VVSDTTVQQVFAAQDREPTVEIWEGEEETTTFRRNRFSRVLPYVYGVVGTLILVSAIYMYDNSKANLSSLNPFKSNHQMEPIAKIKEEITPTLPAKIEAKPFVNETPVASITPSETINIIEKRFFIITGSFGSKQNAKSLLNKLKAKGFEDASIIYPSRNEKLIKVSAGGFSDEAQADQVALKVSESINQNTWIYKK
jgi:cell division septation protein DedD